MALTQRQLAITKTPRLHGTYCLRVRLSDGGTLEYMSSRAQTFDELVDALRERIADVRRIQQVQGVDQ